MSSSPDSWSHQPGRRAKAGVIQITGYHSFPEEMGVRADSAPANDHLLRSRRSQCLEQVIRHVR
jgi:hypothetical protein